MRIWLSEFLIGLFYIVTGIVAVAGTTTVESLVFERESIDLGQVVEGQTCKAVFRFRNLGNVDVRINDVKTSCSCTTVGEKPTLVAPQGQSSLTVRLNTKGKREVVHSVCLVIYRVGERSFVKRLQVAARVIPREKLLVVPDNLFLGTVSAGFHVKRTISLRQQPGSAKQVQVKTVEGPQWLQLNLRRDAHLANEWDLLIDGQVPDVVGSLNDRIIVRTDDKDDPEDVIVVSAYVEDGIHVEPVSVVQIVFGENGAEPFRVALRGGKAGEVQVLATTIDGASGEAVHVETRDGKTVAEKTVVLTARFTKSDSKMLEGAVLVKARAEGKDVTIRIPFLFVKAD